jgi:NADH-quinone oxidoreductase subunit L
MDIEFSTLFAGILFCPFVAALAIAFFLRRLPRMAMATSIGSALIGMLGTLHFLYYWDRTPFMVSCEWLKLGEFVVSMGFFVDSQAALLLFVVTFVGFWIHIFSIGYMAEDGARARFFGGLSIFMFSMLGIVLADNLFMLFIFWELVGFSSYMLIAHYAATEEAASASKKAFIANRVGDVGFLLGILWVYHTFGTVQIQELKLLAQLQPQLVGPAMGFLLMGGFLGKSAQFPLHVWLPDAMAGPTPISALIHAATMVAAGIYFLCRVDFLFTPEVLNVILILGTGMAFYAGCCALAQRDIKKILAYSTLSQLGYMAAAFGLGYPGLALFHLTCHAFFKALLFLGAGSVIHGCHHEQDIFKMGGLYCKMRLTTLLFGIGMAALCAVTFFSGYYSKEAIIEAASIQHPIAYGFLIATAYLTVVYMVRLFVIAFLGSPQHAHSRGAHESPFVMVLPLVVLAVLSVAGGWDAVWPEALKSIWQGSLQAVHHAIPAEKATWLWALGTGAWVLGSIFALLFYKSNYAGNDRLQTLFPQLYKLLASKLWIDEIYDACIVKIQNRWAALLGFLDVVLIGNILVRGFAGLWGIMGSLLRLAHSGQVQSYALWFFIGLLTFIAGIVFQWI